MVPLKLTCQQFLQHFSLTSHQFIVYKSNKTIWHTLAMFCFDTTVKEEIHLAKCPKKPKIINLSCSKTSNDIELK